MIRIAIVEDNRKYRDDLRKRLQDCQPLDITLICENGRDFLQQLKAMPPANRPEVVLMDIEMSEMDGITATTHAKAAFPDTQVLMLTVFDEEDTLFKAIQAGASGYLLKEETAEAICNAILEVQRGHGAMSAVMARKALDFIRREAPKEPDQKQEVNSETLTKRELEILELVSKGHTYPKIAEMVSISEETVKKHIRNIYAKLHVNNKIAATKIAIEKNWFKK
jgi:DNA-binding NarL/FixJ family response regulator